MSETVDPTTLSKSTLSAVAPHVKPQALQASVAVPPTTVGSGLIFCEWCGNSNPCGCWQRMFAESLRSNLTALTGFTMSWRPQVIKRQRCLWVLDMSARRTGETECGLSAGWMTPRAKEDCDYQYDRGDHTKPRPTLTGQVKGWPTPRAGDSEQTGAHRGVPDTLTSATRAWPAPNSMDGERGAESRQTKKNRGSGRVNLRETVGQARQANSSTNGSPTGCLASRWVATLQGFPSDWCELPISTLSELMGIPSSQIVPKS